MSSGIIRRLPITVTAVVLIAAAAFSPGAPAAADPSQDQKFFDLLDQKEIPPVDNANSLIAVAKKACSKLDEGMLQPQGRITRTIDLFINASVEAYCPDDRGKIASIAGYRASPSTSRRVMLASYVEPRPAGDIAPTKPLPVPAQPPPAPEEISPPPEQPPPPPARRVQPAPPQAPPQQAEPPPGAAPDPEPPAAPPPGDRAPGGDTPESPTPDAPSPPGHIRLVP